MLKIIKQNFLNEGEHQRRLIDIWMRTLNAYV